MNRFYRSLGKPSERNFENLPPPKIKSKDVRDNFYCPYNHPGVRGTAICYLTEFWWKLPINCLLFSSGVCQCYFTISHRSIKNIYKNVCHSEFNSTGIYN